MECRFQSLPVIVVCKVLSYLSWKDKLNAVRALPTWEHCLYSTAAWPCLSYHEGRLTKLQDRQQVSKCICTYGRHISKVHLTFKYALGKCGAKIFKDIAIHCRQLRQLKTIRTMWSVRAVQDYCRILEKCLKLEDISLIRPTLVWSENSDENVVTLLAWHRHAQKVTELVLASESLVEHEGPLEILQRFTNLHRLKIRREELTEDILVHLANHELRDLSLFQDEEADLEEPLLYTPQTWKLICQRKPHFQVSLILRNVVVLRSLFTAFAPLRAIVLVDLGASLTKGIVDTIAEYYQKTLEIFVYTKSYVVTCAQLEDRRLPVALHDLVKKCSLLHTLVYGFAISSTTTLLIAQARKLRRFDISMEELSLSLDWQPECDWTAGFIDWLKSAGSSVEALERAVSNLQGCQWHVSTEFMMWQNVDYYTNL